MEWVENYEVSDLNPSVGKNTLGDFFPYIQVSVAKLPYACAGGK